LEVVVREFGGLGNQLFQYAAGRYYAKQYGAAMSIAVDPAWNAQCNGLPRPCLLQHFSIPARMEERSLRDRILLTDKPWLQAAVIPFKRAFRVQVFNEQPGHLYHFLPDLPLEPHVETLYLQGYFQTHLLVGEVADELREDLIFKEPPQGTNRELLQKISQSRNPVSLHVRRGDSILPWEGKVVLSTDYYYQAISIMKERLVDPTFFVFSDDMDFVKESLRWDARMVFVEHNDDFTAHEDLRLMSSCHHHIIANSTFSWWGAWLTPRLDKTVIAPSRWFLAGDNRHQNLIPPDWILLDSVASAAFS
jgi:hypothetical protein